MSSAGEPYRLVVTASARRALSDRLPEDVAAAAWELISGDLVIGPHRVGKQLDEPFEGLWAARRGTYRVVYRINDRARTVTIISVRHRKDAYRT
jgi:mRNA-degrading endonuclease RelE of RelBE toxin-antitoxin system